VTLRRILTLVGAVLLFSLPAAADTSTPVLQGTFAHFAVDSTWSTTFILINTSGVEATARLSFFGDDGQPLTIQIVGGAKDSAPQVTVPPGGSRTLSLDGGGASLQGWAKLELMEFGEIRGQILFHKNAGGGQADAVVPLDLGYQRPMCLWPLPNQVPPNATLLPFDNTANTFATGLALVNISSATKIFDLEYADESGLVLFTDHVTLLANQHTAFMTNDPAHSNSVSAAAKGVLRVKASQTDVSALGLLFRPGYPFSTIIPIATN